MADAVQTIQEAPVASPGPQRWSLPRRVGWRFLCCYFILYILPDQGHVNLVSPIPFSSYVIRPYIRMWRAIVPWVAVHLFHLSGSAVVYPTVNGSGDSTLDYVQNFCYLLVAAAAALVWSVLDRKRPNYRAFEAWLRVFVRYALAFTLFGYGFAKVIPLQFQPPGFTRLLEPLSNFSPMGLLWTFVGYSKAYTIFSGAAEVLGGALLLFRRTATLGAMVSAAVLGNVVALNFCYDVPVKLYSTNLLLMAIYLMAADLRRLVNFLVLNRPVPPADLSGARFANPRLRYAALAFQILFVGYALYGQISGGLRFYATAVLHPKRPPLYGLYEVESFQRNGQEIPPLTSDSSRWKRLILQTPANASVQHMDDTSRTYGAEYDTVNHRLTLTTRADRQAFQYSQPDPTHLLLQGDALQVRLREVDTSKYLLMSRGFNWINERPLNR